MSSPFIWESDEGVTITPPPADLDPVQAEIDRIDQLLAAAGVDIGDAGPSSLYVSRKVLNTGDLRTWAKDAGITGLVVADDLHVTICYSTRPVDWMEMGQPWEEEIEIPAGGPRLVEIFGDSAVVLRFASSSLKWRHDEFVRGGASWDFPSYAPHITLSLSGVVPEGIKPYTGRIRLGPEIFEEIKQ